MHEDVGLSEAAEGDGQAVDGLRVGFVFRTRFSRICWATSWGRRRVTSGSSGQGQLVPGKTA